MRFELCTPDLDQCDYYSYLIKDGLGEVRMSEVALLVLGYSIYVARVVQKLGLVYRNSFTKIQLDFFPLQCKSSLMYFPSRSNEGGIRR